ncbi:MAG TPA: YceI family protein, partial [Polyangiaceae bacterium]|nr:YceI family protein [Polyangiaceae bacterium]
MTHSESGCVSCPGLLLSLGLSYLGGCGGAPLAEQLATAGAPRAASADESLTLYCIERERSRIAAVAFAMGTRHEISIPEFSGSVRMASDGTPRRLSLHVDLTSAEGSADWITELVRSERFLHVESFPKASFASTRIKAHKTTLELEGDLTLRGVTHRLRILATGREIPPKAQIAPQTSR